jgi:hypothetical protein
MRQTRRHRALTALIALFGMLFMQLAVAAHGCPGMHGAGIEHSAMLGADGQPMPDCASSERLRAGPVPVHCQDDTPSLDKAEVKTFAPAIVLFWPVVAALEPVLAGPQLPPEAPSLLQRPTAPPIAIRHCCFRI